MEELLKKYFKWVFTEDFFVVALDYTGCYLFTADIEDSVVEEQRKAFCKAINLKNGQYLLCVVGRKSKFSFCSWELLDSFAMQATQKRRKVLTETEIQSILDCYGVETKNNVIRQEEKQEEVFETQIRQPKQGRMPALWVSLFFVVVAVGFLVGRQTFPAILLAVTALTVSGRVHAKTESLMALIVKRIALTVLIVGAVTLAVELSPTGIGDFARAFFGERK